MILRTFGALSKQSENSSQVQWMRRIHQKDLLLKLPRISQSCRPVSRSSVCVYVWFCLSSVLTEHLFIGTYLSELQFYSQLPDLIDPTAPNETVGIDRNTNSFQSPAHPEVFATLAPLPSSMQLEPLINVHKQRLIASTIKSLVAGQHLASRVAHPVDKRLFQRCVKLRGLNDTMLQRALTMYHKS
jgi:hypothetical protein